MANDNLRQALKQAGIQPDELADIVQVDMRSVRRWLAGTTPRPRQRAKVARALDTPEHQLWPRTATTARAAAQPSDLIAAHSSATDLAAPDWKTLMEQASRQIHLLITAGDPILATADLPRLLATKTNHGCEVQILTTANNSQLTPFLEAGGSEIRTLDQPIAETIYRFDDQLLVMIHLVGREARQAPLLHLRRLTANGLFDKFADHYSQLWDRGVTPKTAEVDASGSDEPKTLALEKGLQPERPRSAFASPRRWPGTPR